MSLYTTDEVLDMMEQWYEDHKAAPDFDPKMPFRGFDGLLGKDLREINLGTEILTEKVEKYKHDNHGKGDPPWLQRRGDSYSTGEIIGIRLSGAEISRDENGKRTRLNKAQLQGAFFMNAFFEGVRLSSADMENAFLVGAELRGAKLNHAKLVKVNLQQAQLQDAELYGATLDNVWLDGADLTGANLSRSRINDSRFSQAILHSAHLEGIKLQDSDFGGAQLQDAVLERADIRTTSFASARLDRARLSRAEIKDSEFRDAKFTGANLYLAEFDEARLGDVDWSEGYRLYESDTYGAERAYRKLKQYYIRTGQSDIAGELHYREMLMKRKNLWRGQAAAHPHRRSESPIRRLKLKLESLTLYFLQVSSGYGERPTWTVYWGLFGWLVFGLAYYLGQATARGAGYSGAHISQALFDSALPFVSFTPPGLPKIVPEASIPSWAHTLALIEGLLAYFLLALFLVTFVRKMSRS